MRVDSQAQHGIVVPSLVEAVADEKHVGDGDSRLGRKLADSVGFVDSLAGDIDRRRASRTHLKLWKQRCSGGP